MGNHAAFANYNKLGTNLFNNLEDMGAVKNGFAFTAENLNEIFYDHRRGDIETRKRLIQNQDVGIVH